MRYLVGFAVDLTAVLAPAAWVNAQAAQDADPLGGGSGDHATAEPLLEEPEPVLEEYTLEEMDRRVRRARGGVAAIVFVGSGVAIMGGASGGCVVIDFGDCSPEPYVGPVIATGVILMIGGMVGMGYFGHALRHRKRDRERLRQSHYGTPHLVQWDPLTSRFVF